MSTTTPEIIPLDTILSNNQQLVLTPEQESRVQAIASKIDIDNPQSIQVFGVESQRKLASCSEQILSNVKNKDTGSAGKALNELVTYVRGLGIDNVSNEKRGFIGNIVARFVNPLAKFIQGYESTQSQIETIVNSLESHSMQLNRDVVLLENLFQASIVQFKEMEFYIIAGERTSADWSTRLIPSMEMEAKSSGDILLGQKLRDAVSRRDDLERKIQDLKLTRMATLQSLPQIRLVQEVDKSLANKIQTSILTTIPIWKSQIALAITLFRQREAIETQKRVSDTTNDLLRKNAEMVQQNNAEARKEIERGVIDIETIKQVHEKLLGMINDTIQITQDAKQKRILAAQEMLALEGNLKAALLKQN